MVSVEGDEKTLFKGPCPTQQNFGGCTDATMLRDGSVQATLWANQSLHCQFQAEPLNSEMPN